MEKILWEKRKESLGQTYKDNLRIKHKKYFNHLMDKFADSHGLDLYEKEIYRQLHDAKSPEGYAIMSVSELIEKCRCGESTIYRKYKSLEAKGLILRHNRGTLKGIIMTNGFFILKFPEKKTLNKSNGEVHNICSVTKTEHINASCSYTDIRDINPENCPTFEQGRKQPPGWKPPQTQETWDAYRDMKWEADENYKQAEGYAPIQSMNEGGESEGRAESKKTGAQRKPTAPKNAEAATQPKGAFTKMRSLVLTLFPRGSWFLTAQRQFINMLTRHLVTKYTPREMETGISRAFGCQTERNRFMMPESSPMQRLYNEYRRIGETGKYILRERQKARLPVLA